jgi:hypothetical protein
MDRRTAITAVGAIALAALLVLAYVFGGGAEAPPPAATAPDPARGAGALGRQGLAGDGRVSPEPDPRNGIPQPGGLDQTCRSRLENEA